MTELKWENGVPVSGRFNDPYYSRADGLAETRHVFLDGNNLPARWSHLQAFHIAELGFGTGLNFCATWQAWETSKTQGQLHFTSFELYPLEADEIDRALTAWPELYDYRLRLVDAWTPKGGIMTFGPVTLEVVTGDVRKTLPDWNGKADAWFLDGFAPARNPQMWEDSVLQGVSKASSTGASFATYTVAGFVRRALTTAGFKLEKRAGFGRKREMLTGRLNICDLLADGV